MIKIKNRKIKAEGDVAELCTDINGILMIVLDEIIEDKAYAEIRETFVEDIKLILDCKSKKELKEIRMNTIKNILKTRGE